MEKINTEILVSSLFLLGFDRVDSLLYTYTLGELYSDISNMKLFDFEDNEFSQKFERYVYHDDNIFKLKKGFSLISNVGDDYYLPLKESLNTNRKLLECLNKLDFRKIVLKKILSLGIDQIDNFDRLFSSREKEIMYTMFGIENMHRENMKKQSEAYKRIASEEDRELELMMSGLERIKEKRKSK